VEEIDDDDDDDEYHRPSASYVYVNHQHLLSYFSFSSVGMHQTWMRGLQLSYVHTSESAQLDIW
jgi:hypothetical protein